MRTFELWVRDLAALMGLGGAVAVWLGFPVLWTLVLIVVLLDIGAIALMGKKKDPPSKQRAPRYFRTSMSAG